MSTVKCRYPKEEFARRGDAIFQNDIAPRLKAEDNGKFVLIDIDTGDFGVGEDELEAGDRLHARLPDAQIWTVRLGSPYVHRYGALRIK